MFGEPELGCLQFGDGDGVAPGMSAQEAMRVLPSGRRYEILKGMKLEPKFKTWTYIHLIDFALQVHGQAFADGLV